MKNPKNMIPMSEISTYKSNNKIRYPNHEWGKPRKGKIKCGVCELEIHKEDKIFNAYCRIKHSWMINLKPLYHKFICEYCNLKVWKYEKHMSVFCSEKAIAKLLRRQE